MGKLAQRKGKEEENRVIDAIAKAWKGYAEVRDTRREQAAYGGGRDFIARLKSGHLIPICGQIANDKRLGAYVYDKLAEAEAAAMEGELSVAILRGYRKRRPVVVMDFDEWLNWTTMAIAYIVYLYNKEKQ